MSSSNDDATCARQTIEFHFQEIFSGERIALLTGDDVRARFVASTQFQIGLAHIERLELCDGEAVTIRVEDLNLDVTVNIEVAKPFVTVNLQNGQVRIDKVEKTPGYV